VVGLVLIALAWGAWVTWGVGDPPVVRIESSLPAIGRSTELIIEAVEEKRGLGSLRVELVQGESVTGLADAAWEKPPFWAPWRSAEARRTMTVEVGRDHHDLTPGEATIRASARGLGSWLRPAAETVSDLTLPVRLRPPGLGVSSIRNYAAQGGTGTVVYRVSSTAIRDGVEVGEWWYPGFDLPGGREGERFALFAVPFDLEDPAQIRLSATDDAGNEAEVPFLDQLLSKPYRSDTIRISDEFLARVVPAILSQTPELDDLGDPLENYLVINRDLRQSNAEVIRQLAAGSPERFLWSETFVSMPGAQVMSSFADRRTYVYEGREIDQQDHLGFDLASVKHARIPAANDGIVVLARYLGIYGNAVIIDHGYGLMSLYGHLSTIETEEGRTVKRGETIGRTGVTGLSGGDHLHFSMVLHGTPVTPVEWWDAKWIEDRLRSKLRREEADAG
jgi:murein DD-endopeptidase MepM/ murein hydrolase activator NlpD